jgi:hypothetical protein
MQLERGKTSTSLLGSFRSIIREEGCVHYTRLSPRQPNSELFAVASDVSTAVGVDPQIRHDDYDSTQCRKGLVPPLLLEAPKRATKLCASFTHLFIVPVLSRNDTLPTQRCK